MTPAAAALFEMIRDLWRAPAGEAVATILPRDPDTLAGFYPRLREAVTGWPRRREGTVDPGAIVRGEIVSMGEGSVVEAGAVIHESCRLVLGRGSRVRSGAVLRDEVVIGDDCLVGVHCEVVRSLLLGPRTVLGHFVFLADSIVGRDAMLSGNVFTANTAVHAGRRVRLKYRGERIDSGRNHLGALVGDGVRFGASTTLCPGCVVAPGLTLPPQVLLYGTIDAPRRDALMRAFFASWDEGGAA
jgi:bifunctional UDP-N-acetylglucosamine pyrophosphorylase / glucosamine-1-phosphate N-acetyltransferase